MERSSASHALRLTTPCVLLEGYTNDPFSMPGLRKLVGYLKTTAEFCMMLEMPVAGQGKLKASERYWILENYSDSDWSGHQAHRRSTSCGLHNCCQHGFVHGTAYFFFRYTKGQDYLMEDTSLCLPLNEDIHIA